MNANIPLLVAGRPFQASEVSYIDVDNISAACKAVDYLIQLGYQQIGTIAGTANTSVGMDRKEGYGRALVERGRAVDPALIVEGDFTETGGYAAMQQLLPARPDAVFAASDIMAIGAMRAVREAGLCVPQDIAFVGFDDLPFATVAEPQLTTVHQPVYQFGYKAIEVLIDLIEKGAHPPRQVIMDTELIVRDSCGAKQKGSLDRKLRDA